MSAETSWYHSCWSSAECRRGKGKREEGERGWRALLIEKGKRIQTKTVSGLRTGKVVLADLEGGLTELETARNAGTCCVAQGLCKHQLGHTWKGRIFEKICCGLWVFFPFYFHEMTVKTRFVFQLTFWPPDYFLHSISSLPLTGWPTKEKRTWLYEGYKWKCLLPTFDQIL